ncbi:UNKNOWN [Stylonychia lemnae]|uniref:Uncharacterized protein n=1 Tax=Stylonychia lemnae TaxID=5949 RepID=A0A078AFG9_STYLE|nr:UNKNOWN [Stylonychia lemnae]|eukprot:CDW80581.1 UNKNOWN [Stylonychia lemnae]
MQLNGFLSLLVLLIIFMMTSSIQADQTFVDKITEQAQALKKTSNRIVKKW